MRKTQNSKLKTQNLQVGQIVLILVLITVVGLTIGLSLISRTVTDVRISSQIEQSSRAFSAAEAGIESALKSGTVGPTGTLNLPGATSNYQVINLGGSTAPLSFPMTTAGTSQTVWLTEHTSETTLSEKATDSYPLDSSFYLCWGTDPDKEPAILLTLIYKDTTTYRLAKAAYDPSPAGRTPNSNFYGVDLTGYCRSQYQYQYEKQLTISNTPPDGFGVSDLSAVPLVLRIQPIFDDTALAIVPSARLPVQGKLITSIGKTETDVVRKIQVTQGYQVLPTLLDFNLFVED